MARGRSAYLVTEEGRYKAHLRNVASSFEHGYRALIAKARIDTALILTIAFEVGSFSSIWRNCRLRFQGKCPGPAFEQLPAGVYLMTEEGRYEATWKREFKLAWREACLPTWLPRRVYIRPTFEMSPAASNMVNGP